VFFYSEIRRKPQFGREYSELAFLLASDDKIFDGFGGSIDGNIIVVGALSAESNKEAIYVYRIVDDANNNIMSVSEMAKLTASNGIYIW
jgi:hypothetical protein